MVVEFVECVLLSHAFAYRCVHSRAVWSCFSLLDISSWAIDSTNGSAAHTMMRERACQPVHTTWNSPGLGSVSSELMDNRTFEMDSAGLQLSLRMSKHIPPWELMLQW